jgi:hypothetical protein
VYVWDNDIHANDYVGLHVNGDVSEGLPGVVSQIFILGNFIYDNGQNGINADGLQSSIIRNNIIYNNARNGIELYQIDAYGGSSDNCITNNTIDQSMVNGSYAIAIAACQYDNQSSQPTPAACASGAMDTSTGNVAFNNILFGKAGTASTVSANDLSTSNNLIDYSAALFIDAAGGNYKLAPAGAAIGTGIMAFDSCDAAPAASNSYDIGAFLVGFTP